MKMYCSECKQKSEDGLLQHLDTCSAKLFESPPGIDYMRPPSITIKFKDKAEQDKFFKNLIGGSGLIAEGKEE